MRLELSASGYTLASCQGLVVDKDAAAEAAALQRGCSETYCDFGECVSTEQGAGCLCDEGFVARSFTDVDGQASLTCVPARGTVDFAAGGVELPSACADTEVPSGECVDVGGFASVACDAGMAAVVGGGARALPRCVPLSFGSGDRGARDYSPALLDLEVCSRPPPTCGPNSWLQKLDVIRPGVDCGDAPDASRFEIPPPPVCSPEGSAMAEAGEGSAEGSVPKAQFGSSLPRDDKNAALNCHTSARLGARSPAWWLALVAPLLLLRLLRRRAALSSLDVRRDRGTARR